jgi:hypothetical protein
LTIKVTGSQSIEISRPQGFDAGALYEVTYMAKEPVLFGMGFAVTRDVTALLKSKSNAMNPLAQNGNSNIQRAIGFGVSQSGRFLRDFLWLGFNEDLNGQQVFEDSCLTLLAREEWPPITGLDNPAEIQGILKILLGKLIFSHSHMK